MTELSTPHAILARQKLFSTPKHDDLKGTKDAPVEVEEGEPIIREESEEEDRQNLEDIPSATDMENSISRKRGRDEDDVVSVSDESSDFDPHEGLPTKRKTGAEEDDKKKLGFNTTYDGFRIYGRILCLVVKRKTSSKGKQAVGGSTGQVMMEEWIASTQAEENRLIDD